MTVTAMAPRDGASDRVSMPEELGRREAAVSRRFRRIVHLDGDTTMRTQTRRWQSHRDHTWATAFEACATNRKRLIRALGYSKQWLSRVIREGTGPYGTFYSDVEKMGEDPDTDPSPMLAAAHAMAGRGMFTRVPDDDLADVLRMAIELEEVSEARGNPIGLRFAMLDEPDAEDRRELREATLDEMARETTVVAITLEQDRRELEGQA